MALTYIGKDAQDIINAVTKAQNAVNRAILISQLTNQRNKI